MSSKSVSQILKILFQTGDINSFVLRGVFFSRYVQLVTLHNFFLSVSFIVSVQVGIFPLNMCDIIIYIAR